MRIRKRQQQLARLEGKAISALERLLASDDPKIVLAAVAKLEKLRARLAPDRDPDLDPVIRTDGDEFFMDDTPPDTPTETGVPVAQETPAIALRPIVQEETGEFAPVDHELAKAAAHANAQLPFRENAEFAAIFGDGVKFATETGSYSVATGHVSADEAERTAQRARAEIQRRSGR